MSFYCVRCRKRMTGLRVTISKKEERREEIAQCLDADDGSASMSKAVDQDYAKLIREGKLTGKILCASHVPSVKLVGRKIRNGSNSSKNKVPANTRVHKAFRQYAKTIPRKPANYEVFEDDAQSDLDEYCDLDDNDNCTEDNYEEQEQDEHEMYTPPTDSDSYTSDEERLHRDDPFFSSTRFIVTGSMLLKFAEQILSFDCPCARPKIECIGRRVSTSATVQMECGGCRKPSKWNSQEPQFPEDRQKTLNHELPIAATLTGVSYTRFLSMCNILRIAVPSMSTRKRVMQQNGWNAIQNIFLADRLDSIKRVKDHYKEENDQVPKLHIEADGQFDSPGYSSLLCKVSLFETRTGLCLLSNTLDKRDEGSTSAGMELIGIKRGMEQLETLGMSVKSLTTDKSSSVRKHMAVAHGPKSKKPIRHYYDFWHLAKNCNNKLRKAAKTKRNSPLVKWRQSIINYLYAVREQGNGDPVKIRELLLGMLYHVSGKHRWQKDTRFTHYKKCPHGRLARDKTFLSPNGFVYKALREIISDEFITSMTRISPAGSTSRVECFHGLSLMYTPKRTYVNRETYERRTMIAILRYNALRKAELDGRRAVVRTVKVARKHRETLTTKKIREGGEEHAWMQQIMEEATKLKKSSNTHYMRRKSQEVTSDDSENECSENEDEQAARLQDLLRTKLGDSESEADEQEIESDVYSDEY